ARTRPARHVHQRKHRLGLEGSRPPGRPVLAQPGALAVTDMKLRITIEGVAYDVDVEILDDGMGGATPPTPAAPAVPRPAAAPAAAAPAAAAPVAPPAAAP